jgi:hypothetical protein
MPGVVQPNVLGRCGGCRDFDVDAGIPANRSALALGGPKRGNVHAKAAALSTRRASRPEETPSMPPPSPRKQSLKLTRLDRI